MISFIAAVADNNVIGNKNNLLWHIPEDLKRFKEITIGHCVLMGRKTFESILSRIGKPLPHRTNIVITRNRGYNVPKEVEKYVSIDGALAAHKDEDIFIIGGASIYRQTLGKADTLYITHVNQFPDGDAKFPEVNWDEWKQTQNELHKGFCFTVYKRKS